MPSPRKTPPRKPAKTAAQRMAAYRARMRAQGLKPVTLWLPDRKDPKFIAACRREALAIAKSDPAGDEIMREIESLSAWVDD